MALKAGGRSSRAIRFAVTNQKTRRRIDGPAAEKVQNHSRGGFAPVASEAILGKRRIRVKRAVTDVVEMSS